METRDFGIDGLADFIEIGSGGFATVFAATDQRFGRKVAVKILISLDGDGRRRFDREQLSMGRMTGHTNVVIPFSSGSTAGGHPYLVMEYLSGGTMADVIAKNGPLSWDRAVEDLAPIADALGHGHRHGVLHRDVKPANILLDAFGVTKLADFGISSVREGTATQLRPFTLAHAPPETFVDGVDRRDERSDLYSLASTLYQVVTGIPPYQSATPEDSQMAYMMRISTHPIPRVGGDPRRDQFLSAALAKNPADRPQTAAAFIAGLAATVGLADDSRTVAHRLRSTDATLDFGEDLGVWLPPAVPLAPRPGWYPIEGDLERYWDGGDWLAITRPAEPSQRPAQPTASSVARPLGPPPGWYDDPEGDRSLERHWDGDRWSELTRPISHPSGSRIVLDDDTPRM